MPENGETDIQQAVADFKQFAAEQEAALQEAGDDVDQLRVVMSVLETRHKAFLRLIINHDPMFDEDDNDDALATQAREVDKRVEQLKQEYGAKIPKPDYSPAPREI